MGCDFFRISANVILRVGNWRGASCTGDVVDQKTETALVLNVD